MAKPGYWTLSNRAVGKLAVEKDTVFWDRELTGFGVRVYPTGSKVCIAQARGPEGPRRVAVGRHGVTLGVPSFVPAPWYHPCPKNAKNADGRRFMIRR